MFDWAIKKCRYCGRQLNDIMMDKLSDNCPKSPDGEHDFKEEAKTNVT